MTYPFPSLCDETHCVTDVECNVGQVNAGFQVHFNPKYPLKMNNWTIGKRITIGFVAMVVVALAIGILGYANLKRVKGCTESLLTDSMPGALYMGVIKDNLSQSHAVLARHLLTTDAGEIAELEKQFQALSASNAEYYDKYQGTITRADDQQKFNHLNATRESYVKAVQDVFAFSKDNDNEATTAFMR